MLAYDTWAFWASLTNAFLIGYLPKFQFWNHIQKILLRDGLPVETLLPYHTTNVIRHLLRTNINKKAKTVL